MTLRIGEICAGYGGLAMAVQAVMPAEVAWFADNDPGATAVLKHHWPHTPNHGDITTIDWPTVEPVDIVTAGFPCQDISHAGQRIGIEGERSGIWAHVVGAIGVLRPRYAVLENVSALVVRGLDRVLADLAAVGFDAEWTSLRASDVGAAHQRNRWFCVAWPATENPDIEPRHERRIAASSETSGGGHGPTLADEVEHYFVADAADFGHERTGPARRRRPRSADGGVATGATDWGVYGPAIARWERVIGRSAPAPTVLGRTGQRLSPVFVEWLIGIPAGHVTAVPGLSRNQMLHLLGNGVVPAQGSEAVRLLMQSCPKV